MDFITPKEAGANTEIAYQQWRRYCVRFPGFAIQQRGHGRAGKIWLIPRQHVERVAAGEHPKAVAESAKS
jgi:hypothetical protein